MNVFEDIAQALEKGSPYILYRQDLAAILRKVAAAHSNDDRTKNDAALRDSADNEDNEETWQRK